MHVEHCWLGHLGCINTWCWSKYMWACNCGYGPGWSPTTTTTTLPFVCVYDGHPKLDIGRDSMWSLALFLGWLVGGGGGFGWRIFIRFPVWLAAAFWVVVWVVHRRVSARIKIFREILFFSRHFAMRFRANKKNNLHNFFKTKTWQW